MKYSITTQKELRRQFWATFPELNRKKITYGKGKEYVCDTRVVWVDWIDSLSKDGIISSELADRATL